MALSNPDRASATSIDTHGARLFIPRYPHAMHVLSAPRIACPVSSQYPHALHVLSVADAAHRLGIPVGHVFVAKHRVQKMLQDEVRILKNEPD